MDTFELYRHEGSEFRSIHARIGPDEFRPVTRDMGPTTEEVRGDADYAFWTTVPGQAWGDLLQALAREFPANDPRASDRLRDICLRHGVKHEWRQWIWPAFRVHGTDPRACTGRIRQPRGTGMIAACHLAVRRGQKPPVALQMSCKCPNPAWSARSTDGG